MVERLNAVRVFIELLSPLISPQLLNHFQGMAEGFLTGRTVTGSRSDTTSLGTVQSWVVIQTSNLGVMYVETVCRGNPPGYGEVGAGAQRPPQPGILTSDFLSDWLFPSES